MPCWDGLAASILTASVGNEPLGKLPPLNDTVKGYAPTAPRKFTGKICTSNIPNPPRTEVFPVRNGSHEKPTRGSKSRREGVASIGCPVCLPESVRLCKLASWPLISLGTVAISYRSPALIVRLGRE